VVDRELVQRRLERLDEYLDILRKLQRYSREEFVADPERYGSAERFLQLSIEVLSDLGNHVIADEGLGTVKVTADIPRLLHDAGMLDADMADCWARMIGFRNVLVHEYLDINRSIVHENLAQRLEDFQQLKRMFARLL
jgi:uncharacterized protein YutE (UPF0331/DUF86 family)